MERRISEGGGEENGNHQVNIGRFLVLNSVFTSWENKDDSPAKLAGALVKF